MAKITASPLATFEAVVRLGSLSAAADELHITEGAISRQLSNLSARLGGPLFHRAGRKLEATADAKALAGEIRIANARIEEATARFKMSHVGLPLRVAALPTFSTLWLIPRLGKLREALPDLSITLITHVDPNTFILNEGLADVLIDVGRRPQNRDLRYASFMDDTSGPVLSAKLAQKCGGINSLEDLAKVAHLNPRSRPNIFEEWCAAAGVVSQPTVVQETFDHVYHTIQAATAGLGFAIASSCYIKDAIERGDLIAPLGLTRREIPFYLAWPRRLEGDRRVHTLQRWLKKEAQSAHGGTGFGDRDAPSLSARR